MERNWFRRVLAGEQAPPIYDPQADPRGPDGGFELAEGATLRDVLATWRAEIACARERCTERGLADEFTDNFNFPEKQWDVFAHPTGSAHGSSLPGVHVLDPCRWRSRGCPSVW